MDRMTDEIREEAPWTIMFADDIVICSESKEQVEEKLERWRYSLERRVMKVNRGKTAYMCVRTAAEEKRWRKWMISNT